jgi:hypothetical protein
MNGVLNVCSILVDCVPVVLLWWRVFALLSLSSFLLLLGFVLLLLKASRKLKKLLPKVVNVVHS